MAMLAMVQAAAQAVTVGKNLIASLTTDVNGDPLPPEVEVAPGVTVQDVLDAAAKGHAAAGAFHDRRVVRDRLHELRGALSRELLPLFAHVVEGFRREFGPALVFPSDEFYITAGLKPPRAADYEGFAQYENGIGMVRVLQDDASVTLRRVRSGRISAPRVKRATLACGRLIGSELARLAGEVGDAAGVRLDV
ncbi:MAG TPA: DUF512 domain-containing protein, partial [Dehalococcoidia bacterium]|nr:DUF512 domain-containing protein [Dehalococcoidia bacterium]